MVGRIYTQRIYAIDPRITKKQAIRAINAVKEGLVKDGNPDPNIIAGINDAISRLNIMTDRMFTMQKLEVYIK